MNQGHEGKPTSPVTTIRSLVKKSFGQKFTQMTAQYWLIAGILLCGMGLACVRAETIPAESRVLLSESKSESKSWGHKEMRWNPALYKFSISDLSCCIPGDTQRCGIDIGECMAGSQTCTNLGTWGLCSGIIPMPTDTCGDHMDNDCNGMIDEDCPPTAMTG